MGGRRVIDPSSSRWQPGSAPQTTPQTPEEFAPVLGNLDRQDIDETNGDNPDHHDETSADVSAICDGPPGALDGSLAITVAVQPSEEPSTADDTRTLATSSSVSDIQYHSQMHEDVAPSSSATYFTPPLRDNAAVEPTSSADSTRAEVVLDPLVNHSSPLQQSAFGLSYASQFDTAPGLPSETLFRQREGTPQHAHNPADSRLTYIQGDNYIFSLRVVILSILRRLLEVPPYQTLSLSAPLAPLSNTTAASAPVDNRDPLGIDDHLRRVRQYIQDLSRDLSNNFGIGSIGEYRVGNDRDPRLRRFRRYLPYDVPGGRHGSQGNTRFPTGARSSSQRASTPGLNIRRPSGLPLNLDSDRETQRRLAALDLQTSERPQAYLTSDVEDLLQPPAESDVESIPDTETQVLNTSIQDQQAHDTPTEPNVHDQTIDVEENAVQSGSSVEDEFKTSFRLSDRP